MYLLPPADICLHSDVHIKAANAVILSQLKFSGEALRRASYSMGWARCPLRRIKIINPEIHLVAGKIALEVKLSQVCMIRVIALAASLREPNLYSSARTPRAK